MLFPSEDFLYIFLPLVLVFYFLIPKRFLKIRNLFLLIASLFFYAWGEELMVVLLAGLSLFDWGVALLLDRAGLSARARKILFVVSVAVNLSALLWYKYTLFLLLQVNRILPVSIPYPNIVLPIGISFFTFQALSYLVDVYRKKYPAEKDPVYVMLYVALFPQLIAGPIVRYEDVAAAMRSRRENLTDFCKGATRFCIGLAKKVLLANQMAIIADGVFALVAGGSFHSSAATAWLGGIAYMLQLYFDFAGYSDMAIGLGRMFGFHFNENFNYPYIACNMTDFWRRWHISLQTWFRDYVYIPLGGNRGSKARWIRNIFIVWLLTGIWHGANWTYIAWGLCQFVILMFEKKTGLNQKKCWWGHIYAMVYFMLTVVIFRSTGMRAAFIYIGAMFGIGSTGIADSCTLAYLQQQGFWLVLAVAACLPILPWLEKRFEKKKLWNVAYAVFVSAALVLSLSFIANSAYNPFIYFHF